MLFEAWLQLRGEAGERQLPDAHRALTHNLGGRRRLRLLRRRRR